MTRKTRRPPLPDDDFERDLEHGLEHEPVSVGLSRNTKIVLLIVVVSALGGCCLLGTLLVVPNVMKKLVEAQRAKAVADIRTLDSAVERYRVEHDGAAPASLDDLAGISAPDDPWGRPYQLQVDASGTVTVLSLGADGQPGGEGPAADITSADAEASR